MPNALPPPGFLRDGGQRPVSGRPDLRIHGMEWLRVVDASVMTALSAPTQAPTVMIAEQPCWMGPDAVSSMVQTALTPPAETARIADARWVTGTADHILTVMEDSRSTCRCGMSGPKCNDRSAPSRLLLNMPRHLVDLLVDEVLDHRSVGRT